MAGSTTLRIFITDDEHHATRTALAEPATICLVSPEGENGTVESVVCSDRDTAESLSDQSGFHLAKRFREMWVFSTDIAVSLAIDEIRTLFGPIGISRRFFYEGIPDFPDDDDGQPRALGIGSL
jgi:hypothetical protein